MRSSSARESCSATLLSLAEISRRLANGNLAPRATRSACGSALLTSNLALHELERRDRLAELLALV